MTYQYQRSLQQHQSRETFSLVYVCCLTIRAGDMARKSKDTVAVQTNGTKHVERTNTRSSPRTRKTTTVSEEVIEELTPQKTAPSTTPRAGKRKLKVEEDDDTLPTDTPKKRAKTAKTTVKVKDEVIKSEDQTGEVKIKRKRKTKEEKEAEAMPLAARTAGHKLFIGAHVSASGGECRYPSVYGRHGRCHEHQSKIYSAVGESTTLSRPLSQATSSIAR